MDLFQFSGFPVEKARKRLVFNAPNGEMALARCRRHVEVGQACSAAFLLPNMYASDPEREEGCLSSPPETRRVNASGCQQHHAGLDHEAVLL